MKTITIWERFNLNSEKWDHNHISEGFSEDDSEPAPKSETQRRSWKGAQWRRTRGRLEDGAVIADS